MALRHFTDHITTETGEEVRIEIHDSSFGGTATKLKGAGSGWVSRSVQQLDVREPLSNPIQKSEVSATLWLTSSSLIDDLFSSEEGRFTLIYEKESTEYFEGEILPDLCDYEYLEDSALWKLTVKAKDLSSLDGEYYTDDGTVNGSLESGRVTIIEAIASILPFSKTIKTHTSWIVDGETSADDYLKQIYLDKFALRTYARTGDETDEPITKLEALEWILKANGLVLKQENGWVLDHITAMSDPTDVLESNYDSSGTFVSASSENLTNTAKIVLQSKYNHNPGIKSARLKYDHRTSVTNIQFPARVELNDTDPTSESFSQTFISDGNQQIKLKATVGAITSESPTSSTFSFSMIIDTGTTVYRYRYSDNSWVTGGAVNNVDMLEGVTNSWTGSINITTPDIPSGADGPLTITLNSATDSDGFADETVWDNIFFDIVNAVAEENSTYIDYQLTQTGDQSVRIKYGDVNFGDGPTGYSRGAFTTDSGGANLTLDDWASRDDVPSPTYINHAHILLREVLDVQRKSRTRISATVKSGLSFGDVIAYDGSNYYVLGGSFDGYTGVSSVELLEIDIATGSDTFEKIPKFVADEATGSASTGGSGGATGVTLTEGDERWLQQANNLSDLDSASTARSNLGVAIGSDVQAQSSILQDLGDNLTSTATELNRLDGDLATVRDNLDLTEYQFGGTDLDFGGNVTFFAGSNITISKQVNSSSDIQFSFSATSGTDTYVTGGEAYATPAGGNFDVGINLTTNTAFAPEIDLEALDDRYAELSGATFSGLVSISGSRLELGTQGSTDGSLRLYLENGGSYTSRQFRLDNDGSGNLEIESTFGSGGAPNLILTRAGAERFKFDFDNTIFSIGGNTVWHAGNLTNPVETGDNVSFGTGSFNGNVGIGTSSPDRRLHVSAASQSVQLSLERTGTNVGQYGMGVDGNGLHFWAGGYNFNSTLDISFRQNGNVLIGTTSDNGYKLDVNGTFRSTSTAFASEFEKTSDRRLKSNILQLTGYEFRNLNPVSFTKNDRHSFGFIAQEIKKYYPSLVTKGEDGYYTLAQDHIVAMNTAGLQKVDSEVEQLKNRVHELEQEVQELRRAG